LTGPPLLFHADIVARNLPRNTSRLAEIPLFFALFRKCSHGLAIAHYECKMLENQGFFGLSAFSPGETSKRGYAGSSPAGGTACGVDWSLFASMVS
jgi:hypothetical protein